MTYTYILKIPKNRVGVLIGSEGKIKNEIEEKTGCKLIIDSKEGEVEISCDEGLKLYEGREIVRAISRGFNPEKAMQLINTKNMLEVIDLSDYAGKKKNTLERLKGRVIGTEGKAKKEIETLTETNISIYGKTIGIVGEIEEVQNAKRAIEMILQGSMHKTAYTFLEKKRRQKKIQQIRETQFL